MKTFLLTIILAVQYMGLTSSQTTGAPTTPGYPPYPTHGSCPPTVTWGGGNQIYRFVTAQEFTRCDGIIAECIYHAHFKFYCFSGDKISHLEPKEMYGHFYETQPIQNVVTGPFGYLDSSSSPFNFSTEANPILAWKLCPGVWVQRLVVQAIVIEKLDGTTESAGDCETLTGFPSTELHLGIGDYITEAFGRSGVLLDRLTLIVTPSAKDEYPRVYTSGGPFGGPFDATPSPSKFGSCALVSLDGTVVPYDAGSDPENFIDTIRFFWSCIGVPDTFY